MSKWRELDREVVFIVSADPVYLKLDVSLATQLPSFLLVSVAIYFSQEGKGEYLDSYGIPPLIPGFYTFLEKNTVSWRFNDRTLQGPHSRVCGHYCVFYMLYRCRGRSMDSVVAMFDDDTNDNDDFVYRFISNL